MIKKDNMRTKGIGPQSLGISNVSPLKMADESQGPGDKKMKPGAKPNRSGNRSIASKPMTPVGPTGPKQSRNKPNRS